MIVVRHETGEWQSELAMREFVKDEIAEMKKDFADLRNDIVKYKIDIIRWMFIFWIGYVAAMLFVVLLFVKK